MPRPPVVGPAGGSDPAAGCPGEGGGVVTRPRPLRAGQVVSVEIEKLALLGRGLARHDGMTVFVRDALPGDRAQICITKVKPRYAEARLVQLERPSPHRITPSCRHFGACGGCDLQHVAYATQVAWKRAQLVETLQHLGGLTALPPVAVHPMTDPWHYRNKMEFSFGEVAGGRIVMGLHQRGSFQQIVKLEHCWIAPALASDVLQQVEDAANASGLPAYHPRRHDGFWRYMVIRVAQASGQAHVLLVTNEGDRDAVLRVAQAVTRAVPRVATVLWGVSTRVSDVAHPERTEALIGREVADERIGPLTVQVRPMNFVQPNLTQAERLYEELLAAAALTGREVVYDLYCGIGVIALLTAPRAQRVYGVESDPENIALASSNAARHGVANATFICGKVEELLLQRGLFRLGPPPDLVIVDPPRVGLHPDAIGPLLQAQPPRLFYLSCNPASLARDLKLLLDREPRFRLTRLSLYDFFPQTGHMEVFAALERSV
ncbi:MAG: 23S rRNA (uracil(1939)-C(5))-methyltransferase RlmD [Candidatus Omnitrophica bacterium]|nr:23S rRNA (uracil(1939)-C(5))-methyltransferase RlmD [Candidatus Omnitrophota bacterium]